MGLVADILEMLVIDSDGDVIAHDTLQDSNISVTTETSDVIAGRNNLLAILHGRREIEITGNTPTFKLENLSKHLGTDIVTGAGTAWAFPKWYAVVEDEVTAGTFTITLDKEPLSVDELVIEKEDGTRLDLTGMTLTGSEVTLTDVVDGEMVKVLTYQYATDATTQQLDIDASKFPKDVRIVLQTLEISEDEQPLAYLQFEYERVKPSADFAINTTSAREATSNEMSFRVMKPKFSDTIGTIKRIPIGA